MTAPLDAEQASGAATMFKALGDSIRLRLLSMIASAADGEVCVCDLTGPFDLSAPTISYHLKILREAGVVTSERRGTWVYYRARRDSLEVLSGLIAVPTAEAHGV
ncbi:putative transcriptional regulator, ArsR family [Streptomyces microflavus DSM 40593]|uniref:Putative transcriptional regulator, ArsR family n=1 Tax=Streptomyces microflavus DSM 40593 TaxID=1303692 RepID=N0CHP2_STRMI|nr:metalloregulator ArsR/SmtB family transcription factor [Streptomyces microflavus]AGK75691.1 putative transcriptional regulator, ArsR family [Streptomyces microflavus DSM 40593]